MSGILFDGRWVRPGMTGVGISAFNMLAAFSKMGANAGLILNPGPIPPELKNGFRIFMTKVDLTHHPMTELFEQFGIPYLCYRHGYDSFVSFEGRTPILHPGIKTFAYIHDLSYLNFNRTHGLKYNAFLIISLMSSRIFASRIIAVSHAVAAELQKRLRVPEGRILVLQNADSGLERIPEKTVLNLPASYFFAVGMNNPRKNLPCLLEGFQLYRQQNPNTALVLTGKREWIDSISAAYSVENILNLGFITEGELRFLYRNALGLIYPSKDEGFGLPLMDAYRHSCPVFCSDIPVFREVMGGYASYFDPGSPTDLADKLRLGARLNQGTIGLAPGYTWSTAASLLLESTLGSISNSPKKS